MRGPPRPGILATNADGETFEVKPGEHFVKDAGGGGGGKGKGPPGLRRVSDGMVGTLQEPDVWEMKLDDAEQQRAHMIRFPDEPAQGLEVLWPQTHLRRSRA